MFPFLVAVLIGGSEPPREAFAPTAVLRPAVVVEAEPAWTEVEEVEPEAEAPVVKERPAPARKAAPKRTPKVKTPAKRNGRP